MSVRKLAPALREIRIHLCQNSESSKGVRDFIEQYYTKIKYENPKLPILIRECSGVQPKLWARFSYGKEKCVPLSDKDAECVLQEVGNLAPPC